jgi:hypothetical protein
MPEVILDEDLKARLHGLPSGLKLLQPNGEAAGVLVSPSTYQLLYDWAFAELERSGDDDRESNSIRAWDGTNGKTTEEAIACLENLRRNGSRSEP